MDNYKKYKQNRKFIKKIPLNLESKTIVIVPFRDPENNGIRTKQLNKFLDYYHNYIPNLQILIVEQSQSDKKFNRGKLLNIGFKIAIENQNFTPDIFIFHDVDLISPSEIKSVYSRYPEIPTHIASLWTQKYKFSAFLGGIISFNKEDYIKINGFPNSFYGWGGEDDAMYNRLAINNMNVLVPYLKDVEIYEEEHEPSKSINKNKQQNILNDLKNWKKDGINNLSYKVIDVIELKYYNTYKVIVEL